jgi:hypothetical protein
MSLRGAPSLTGRGGGGGGGGGSGSGGGRSSLTSDLPGFGPSRRGGAVDTSDFDALFAVGSPTLPWNPKP